MTFTFTKGLFSSVKNKGKQILQNALKAKTQKVAVKAAKPPTSFQKCHVGYQPVQIPSRLHQIWRGLVPRVYYNSLAAQLGRQAALRAGKNVPLFAFFGLAVSQNIDQNEDELSLRIQNFIKTASSGDQTLWEGAQKLSLDNFEFGSRIGQGCNAAVYEARLRKAHQVYAEDVATDHSVSEVSILTDDHEEQTEVEPVTESVIVNDSEEGVNKFIEPGDNDQPTLEDSCSFHGNTFFEDSDCESDTDSDITVISWESDEEFLRDEGAPLMFSVDRDNDEYTSEFPIVTPETSDNEFEIIQEDIDDGLSVLQGSMTSFTEVLLNFQRNNDRQEGMEDEANIGPALSLEIGTNSLKLTGFQEVDNDRHGIDDENDKIEGYQSMNSSIIQDDGRTRPKLKFDLAVKMMFNYDIESNATAIMRSMEKETIPARMSALHEHTDILKNRNYERKKALPPHPNVVEMWGVFVDPIPTLPDGLTNYPAALPSRINPDGIGRNMTMFIVMKRYDMTLAEYLSLYNPDLTFRERILMLAQLLEAVDHLNKNGIAHRDMKADNILVDLSSDVPHLVVSDFGCCLANSNHGLMLPYPSDEVDKGGNTALMAPEIVCAEPGPYVKLDYKKADLWSVGAIAYEILGADNPFYSSTQGKLNSYSYTEQELPPLPKGCPQAIEKSLFALLSRNPKKRPSAREVLNIIYAYLWLPSDWLNTSSNMKVTRSEVMWWVVTMATDVTLELKCSNTDSVELTLKTMFIKSFMFGIFKRTLEKFNIFIQA